MPDARIAAEDHGKPLSIIILGASGDLARTKLIPALFALHSQDLLPQDFHVIGFGRKAMSDEEFRNSITEHLTCRYVPGASCQGYMDSFLARCAFVSGQYDSRDDFLNLYARLRELEGGPEANRVYYMAIPPSVFLPVTKSLGDAGLVSCDAGPGWSRTIIEKPFGHDRASSDELVVNIAKVFTEEQVFRIDHYLGKELIQNLMVLRFANLIFDPVWNRSYIDHVLIEWKEDKNLEGRGGYFDQYGIIRDVMQNHLLQILALIAMEQPVRLESHHVRNEKVKVLGAIPPVEVENLVTGQFTSGVHGGKRFDGYLEEGDVAKDSTTETYAAAVLHIRNRRWDGVPFCLVAGKGLGERKTEIRIRFHPVPGSIFGDNTTATPNELVIRVQPDEAIYLDITNKAPGLQMRLVDTALNLQYQAAFSEKIPEAYECLLLDVIRGDKSLFIRKDELAAAWDVFTPVLHELAEKRRRPEPYPFGSEGPAGASALMARYGIR